MKVKIASPLTLLLLPVGLLLTLILYWGLVKLIVATAEVTAKTYDLTLLEAYLWFFTTVGSFVALTLFKMPRSEKVCFFVFFFPFTSGLLWSSPHMAQFFDQPLWLLNSVSYILSSFAGHLLAERFAGSRINFIKEA